jgi:hypothetical protein
VKSSPVFQCACLGLFAVFAAACTPLYMSDVYTTSTPRTQNFDVSKLPSKPISVLGVIAPANLQGLGPSLSHALVTALSKARPPIQAIPAYETISLINERGLARNYADLLSGFAPGGILDAERLRPIGSALGSRYVLLPGLAEFNQLIMDKYEALGIKLVRTRLTTLRLWLQLWDAQTGRLVWESAGEVTSVTPLLNAKRTVPLDRLAQELWLQMIQEDLLGTKTETRLFLRN